MSWFRVDDHLHSHRKAVKAGTEAMGLWILAGSWSAAEESDGWVPAYMLARLAGPNAEALADRLVASDLWECAEDGTGEAGYRFHQWEEHQPTRAQLEAKREAARERMRGVRAQGGDVRANSERTSRSVTPTRPDPTRPNKNTPAPAAADADFDAFWRHYPKKVGKDAARKAWTKAAKRAEVEDVLAGLNAAKAEWTACRTEARFIPHPSTWLNEGRWQDQPMLVDDARPQAQAGPSRTAMQCATADAHDRHPWDDARNAYMCLGVSA